MRGHGQSTHSLPCSLCRSGRRLSSTGSRSAGVIVACGADLIVLEPARMLTLSKPQSIDASLEETYRYLLNSFEPICGFPLQLKRGQLAAAEAERKPRPCVVASAALLWGADDPGGMDIPVVHFVYFTYLRLGVREAVRVSSCNDSIAVGFYLLLAFGVLIVLAGPDQEHVARTGNQPCGRPPGPAG